MSQRLYQRPNSPNWWVSIIVNGKRQQLSTGCRDRRAAEQTARELERRATDPVYRAAHEATLSGALEELLSERSGRGRAEGTIAFYATKAAHLVRVFGEEARLADVDAAGVDRYIALRREEGAAANTISKELITLRAALKVAKRRGKFAGDIGAIMPIAFAPEYKPRRSAVRSLEDLWALIRELPPHRGAHVAFFVATGARDSEAVRAEARDVDLRRGVVYVRGQKTDLSDDTVAIPPWGRPLLEHVLATLGEQHGPLFGPWGSVRGDLAAACRRVAMRRRAATLGTTPGRLARAITRGEVTEKEIREMFPPVTPNDLRRTHGMWLRAAGVEPSLIGRQLRHTDGRMAERVYGRLAPDDLAAVLAERLTAAPGLRAIPGTRLTRVTPALHSDKKRRAKP